MRAQGTLQVHRQRIARRPTVLVQAGLVGPHPVSVTFTVRKHLNYGLHLYLVGSFTTPPWDKKNGVELKWSEGHTWTATVLLPSETKVEYKYVQRSKAGELAEWQSGPNNMLVPPKEADAIEVIDNWDDSQRSKVNITKTYQRPSPSAVAKPKYDPVERLIAAALSSMDQAGSPPPSRSPSPWPTLPSQSPFNNNTSPQAQEQQPQQQPTQPQQQPQQQSQQQSVYNSSSPSPPPRYSNESSFSSNGSSYPFATAPGSNGYSKGTSSSTSYTTGTPSTPTTSSSASQQQSGPSSTSSPSPAPQQAPPPPPQPPAYVPGASPSRMTASELLETLQAQAAAESPPPGILGSPISNGTGATISSNISSSSSSAGPSSSAPGTGTSTNTVQPKGISSNGSSSSTRSSTSSGITSSAQVSSKGVGSNGSSSSSPIPSSPTPSPPSPPNLTSTYSSAANSTKSPSPGTAKRAEQLVQQQQELARAFEEMKSDRSNPAAPALQAVSSQLSAGLEVLGTGSSTHNGSDTTSPASSSNGDVTTDKPTSSAASKAVPAGKSSNGANFQAIKERVLHANSSNGSNSNGHAPRSNIPGMAGASSNIVSTGGAGDSIRGKASAPVNSNQPHSSSGPRPLGPGPSTHQSLGGPSDSFTSVLHNSREPPSVADQEALDSMARAVRNPRMSRVVVKHGQLRTHLGSLSVGELRHELRRRNLPVGGPRPELIARLVEAGVHD